MIESLDQPDTTGRYRGGDLVCAVCGFIVCTLYESAANGPRGK